MASKGQRRRARAKKGRETRAETRAKILSDPALTLDTLKAHFNDPKIIGRGKYNIVKAMTGKNAAAKRARFLNKAVDIGGRSLGALSKAATGDYMGALMSGLKILGKGDYTLTRNSVVQDLTGSQVPVMHSAKESIRFRHREFLGDVYSPNVISNFQTAVYNVNPGLLATFPFLGPIAQQFQTYRFMGLAFEFKSTAAVALSSSNIGMGTVALAAQYRSTAPTFTNRVQMMNEMWSVDGKPCDTFMLPIECAPAETPLDCLYVRGGGIPSTEDLKLYDLCKVTLACTGIPVANQVIGELWVTYDIELFKPQATNVLDQYQPLTELSLGTVGGTTPFANATATFDNIGFVLNPSSFTPNTGVGCFGAPAITVNPVVVNPSLAAGAAITVDRMSIIFPLGLVGTFMLSYFCSGTSATTNLNSGFDAFGNTALGFASQLYQNNWSIIRVQAGPVGAGSITMLVNVLFNIPNSSAQAIMRFNAGNLYPNVANTGFIYLQQINGNAV